LVNDIPTIWRKGYAVKTSTKTMAGVRYNNPVNLRRRMAVIRSPRSDAIGRQADARMMPG
jgi:hypothetical protein